LVLAVWVYEHHLLSTSPGAHPIKTPEISGVIGKTPLSGEQGKVKQSNEQIITAADIDSIPRKKSTSILI
jgi:hypothetical protein